MRSERLEFAAGAFPFEAAVDNLDRLCKAAGGVGLPDFTVAAGAESDYKSCNRE